MADVEYEVRDQIAYITLNRPDKHNAISLHVEDLLEQAWRAFADDDDARVAILSGNGKNFCAGADLTDHVDQGAGAGPSLPYDVQDKGFGGMIARGLHKIPIIAANHGWTVGGGIEISLACDMRVCTEDTQYGFFHIRRGMHFADGGLVRLINICGYGIAMELELLGEPIDAQKAKECHLVNRVVAPGEQVAEAEAMASKIIRNPRVGVESAKRTALEVMGRPLEDQLKLEAFYGYSIMGDPEIVERKDEFLAREEADRPTSSSCRCPMAGLRTSGVSAGLEASGAGRRLRGVSVAEPEEEPVLTIYTPEEALRRARPLPRREDLVAGDTSEEEWARFQEALAET